MARSATSEEIQSNSGLGPITTLMLVQIGCSPETAQQAPTLLESGLADKTLDTLKLQSSNAAQSNPAGIKSSENGELD